MTFEHDDDTRQCDVKIKVIGVGGGGNNAVNRMVKEGIQGVEFISINTDRQALQRSEASTLLVIGEKTTKGFGAGANPQVGAHAAEESIDDIRSLLEGTDMVFITAGMGGGTGTGAAPIVARVARDLDILTVGIVTKPFAFEGSRRMAQAEAGIAEMAQYVDSLIIIPNDRLKQFSAQKVTFQNAFGIADDVLRQGVQSVAELIVKEGFINVDFSDVSSVMRNAGYAHMGIGEASGKDKAQQAVKSAISSPLLETSIKGAQGILISMAVSPDVSFEDAEYAASLITAETGKDANVIFGLSFDESMEDMMRVIVIATGFEKNAADEQPAPEAAKAAPTADAAGKADEKAAEPKAQAAAKPQVKRPSAINAGDDDVWGLVNKNKKNHQ